MTLSEEVVRVTLLEDFCDCQCHSKVWSLDLRPAYLDTFRRNKIETIVYIFQLLM